MDEFSVLEGIPTEAHIKYNNIILFPISKLETSNKDFKRIDLLFQRLNQCGMNARGKLIITFSYDDVSEEIYEIPEVRGYVDMLFLKHPNLFYFLSQEYNVRGVIFACLCDLQLQRPIGKVLTELSVTILIPNQLKEYVEKSMINYGLAAGESEKYIKNYVRNFFTSLIT